MAFDRPVKLDALVQQRAGKRDGQPLHRELDLAQHPVVDAFGLFGLIDQPHAARSHQHLLHAGIAEGADVRLQHVQGRHRFRIVAGDGSIPGPARWQGDPLWQFTEGRIKLAALQAHHQIEDTAIARGCDKRDLEPERGDLAEDDMVNNGLQAHAVALVAPFEHGKVDVVLGDPILLEQGKAIVEEGAPAFAMAAAVTAIKPCQANQGRGCGDGDIPAQSGPSE